MEPEVAKVDPQVEPQVEPQAEPQEEPQAATQVEIPATADDALDRLNALLAKSDQINQIIKGEHTAPAAEGGRRGGGRKTEAEEDEEMTKNDSTEEPRSVRLTEQPSSVTGKMRYYQLEALNWMINLHNNNINGILADEMGLGKTLETISLMAYLKQYRQINGLFLVIVPKSTLSNWKRECNRWCPALRALVFHGDKANRAGLKDTLSNFDVIITTYEMVILEKSVLRRHTWEYIIIDEAHRIKNENSSLALVVRTFESKHRLLITGTPLQNNLHELWALLNFLLPKVFNSADDFESWFDVTQDDIRTTMAARLHKILRPFLLRRLKADVEKSLPAKVETKLFVGMSAMQRAWYTKILSRDMEVLNGTGGGKMRLLNIVMQLRKVTNHPYLFTGAEPGPPYEEGEHLVENAGKMVLLDKLLHKLKAQGSRVLIFSQMTRMLDILEDYCRYRGYQYCRIDGSTKQEDRDNGMENFNAPNSEKFVFLLSTRAGGLGINLQTADTVVLYDSDWNPQMDLQAQDRAHRIGQKKVVHVYRFVTENSVEEKIIERAMRKLFLDAVVIKQGRLADKNKNMSSAELQNMVRFGASRIFQSKDSSITDEDIDAIISRGQDRTQKDSESIKDSGDNNLANFSLGAEQASLYEFEGKTFDSKKPFGGMVFIEPPKRERKKNYDENAYFREAMRISEGTKKNKAAFKPSQRIDFQFFATERLHELEKKEFDSKINLKEMIAQSKILEKEAKKRQAEEERERKRLEKLTQKALEKSAEEAGNADGGADAVATEEGKDEDAGNEGDAPMKEEVVHEEVVKEEVVKEEVVKEEVLKEEATGRRKSSRGAKQEEEEGEEAVKEEETTEEKMRREAGCLTADEEQEKADLEAAGFGSWLKIHFKNFVSACALHGRDNIDDISLNVEGRTEQEVREYAAVFWERYREVKDVDKIMKKIEAGESTLARRDHINHVIHTKVSKSPKPFLNMKIPYPNANAQRALSFTQEEDRWVICTLKEIGYGQWEELKQAVRTSWQFRFDWFLKSRTAKELERRSETLVKMLEKEFDDDQKKSKKSNAKKRKAPTPAKKKSAKKRR